MPLSVRIDPLLEKELERAAKRQGITKSQFVIDAVQRALGQKNPYELLLKIQAQEEREWTRKGRAMPGPTPYDPVKSKAAMIKKLQAKHGVDGAR